MEDIGKVTHNEENPEGQKKKTRKRNRIPKKFRQSSKLSESSTEIAIEENELIVDDKKNDEASRNDKENLTTDGADSKISENEAVKKSSKKNRHKPHKSIGNKSEKNSETPTTDKKPRSRPPIEVRKREKEAVKTSLNSVSSKMEKTNEKSGGGRSKPRDKPENRNFPDYYRKEVIDHALENEVLIIGALRIHNKSYEEAFVSPPDGSGDISIQGNISFCFMM